MISRKTTAFVLAGMLLAAAASPIAGQSCAAARLDVADWALVRSADVPGFTLRLPRAFTRDSTVQASALPTSRTAWWADATRGRLGLIRVAHDSLRAELVSAGGRSGYLRCEEQVGSAVAVIVHYAVAQGSVNGPFVVRASHRPTTPSATSSVHSPALWNRA